MHHDPDEDAPLLGGPKKRGFRFDVYEFIEGKSTLGAVFEAFIMVVILVNVLSFILGTDKSINAQYGYAFGIIETASVILFTIEYLTRLWAIVESPEYSGECGRLKYLTSYYSVIDLIAIIPFYTDLITVNNTIPTPFIRMLRLIRVLRAEGRYLEAFTLFDDVLRGNSHLLLVTGFAGLVVWIVMGTLQYVAEHDNPLVEGRYDSVPRSMWYTSLNLLGEYPINEEWTPWGKFFGVITMMLAVPVFAIPTGVLGAGLTDYLSDQNEEEEGDEDSDPGSSPQPRDHAAGEPDDDDDGELQLQGPEQRMAIRTGFQADIYRFINGMPPEGSDPNTFHWSKVFESFVMLLIVANVVIFSIQTIPKIGADSFFDAFEWASVVFFTFEYIARLYSCVVEKQYQGSWGRFWYMCSFYGVVDLLAILPFYIDQITPGEIFPTTFLRVVRLARMLKADSFVGALSILDDVLAANKSILLAAGFASGVIWILYASLMWLTERHTNDEELRPEFTSVITALWYTLLNLTGEYPTGDYTDPGKCVSIFSALFAIGVFAIPTGVLGSGFEDVMNARQEKDEEEGRAQTWEEAAQQTLTVRDTIDPRAQQRPSSCTGRVSLFLQGVTPKGLLFERFLYAVILINITTFIISTDEYVMRKHQWLDNAFDTIEWVSMMIFTVEYIARLCVAHRDPDYVDKNCPTLRHFFSFFSLLDLLCIAPFWIDVALPNLEIMPTAMFRIFRLMRLLKGEKYNPAFTVLDDVFKSRKVLLSITAFVACICVIVFSTLLHYTEKHNFILVDHLTMAERFESVPRAMFYTFIHLTGDYPLVDYSPLGKVVNVMMIITAVGLVGIPSGIIASGFQEIVSARRKKAKQEAEEELADRPETTEVEEADKRCRRCRVKVAKRQGLQAEVNSFLVGDMVEGRAYEAVLLVIIVLNVICFILGTVQVIDENSWAHFVFGVVEIAAVVVFTFDYLLRVFAAPQFPDYDGRWAYMTSFLAVVDLLSIVPFYVGLFIHQHTIWSTVFRCMRLLRLLKAEHYMEAFTVFDNVIARQRAILVTTSLAALIIWVVASTLLYLTENDNPYMDDAFDSIPSSLFFTIIFLGGEWAKLDFTWMGKIIAVGLCIVGIGLFAIPTGILFSGFEEIVTERREEAERKEQLELKCADCDAKIIHFQYRRLADEE